MRNTLLLTIAVLACLLTLPDSGQAADDPNETASTINGHYWVSSDHNEKYAYIRGLRDGGVLFATPKQAAELA